jgi:hypothetical protein
VFAPRGQSWDIDWRLSLFGQQTFTDSSFDTHENVGTWRKNLRTERKDFQWTAAEDTTRPFVTLHEWLQMDQVPEEARERWAEKFMKSSARFGVAELHFSEPIMVTSQLKVLFRDKDFENTEIKEAPIFDELLLWAGEQTALIGFWQNEIQPNERFAVRLEGLTDTNGNKISDKEYTIIARTN